MTWIVQHFDEIDSTNTYLASRALEGAPEGHVAVAAYQSVGRGRLERQWEAPANSALLCSILLRPSLEPSQLQLVTVALALSARAALVRTSGVRPDLKWPNDLIVNGRKIAGLLSELVMTPEGPAVVAGIGLNLTAHPTHLVATNVREEAGVTVTPAALLDLLLEELDARRALLDTAEGIESLQLEYQKALVTIGASVRVETTNGNFFGVATGVDSAGRLIVTNADETRIFEVGDVTHLRADESEQA